MEENVLKAMARNDTPRRLRRGGMVPGVLNSPAGATDVQFDAAAVGRILEKHGHNAKIWVALGDRKDYGYIHGLQRHPVDGSLLHVSVQLIVADHDVRMHLPIVWHGRDALTQHTQTLLVHRGEVDVSGKAALMPESLVVDVSHRFPGDHITAADFHLPEGLKCHDAADEIYAVVKHTRVVEEAPAEPRPAAPAAAAPTETKPAP